MAQFDAHEIKGHGLVVDCQSHFLRDLQSRVVAPLRDADEPSVSTSRLNPLVSIDGKNYRVATQFMRAVDRRQLGPIVASLRDHEYAIKGAIDLLVSGF